MVGNVSVLLVFLDSSDVGVHTHHSALVPEGPGEAHESMQGHANLLDMLGACFRSSGIPSASRPNELK